MLYSHLLTQSDFDLKHYDVQSAPNADMRYASRLAAAILNLLVDLSGARTREGMPAMTANRRLADSRLARSLAENAALRGMTARAAVHPAVFDNCLADLREEIVSSALFRSYTRGSAGDNPFAAETKFWKDVLRLIVAPNPDFQQDARKIEGYTRVGYERGLIMATEIIDSYGQTRSQLVHAKESLAKSLDKAYELYQGLMWLPVEITRTQALRLDLAQHKYLPTDTDLNPNLRFIDNTFVEAVENSKAMADYRSEHPYDWPSDMHLVDRLLDAVLESDIYKAYMERPDAPDRAADADLWRSLFKSVILPSMALAETLEEQSVFWNDDLDIMGTFVLKTLRRYAQDVAEAAGRDDGAVPEFTPLPQYKDEEDAAFGAQLFDFAIEGRDLFRSLIEQFTRERRWDADRLAFMDIVVIITALAEIMNFPAIPLAVSFNEYIEIAKSYSTARSGDFVNGILHAIVTHLQAEKKLLK